MHEPTRIDAALSFDVPSRDALLAATTPDELFGAVARDGRALRRAWAALVRVYRAEDDPEAFGHARTLFEAARASAMRVVTEDVQAEPDAAVEPAVAPHVALAGALERSDYQAVVDALMPHREELLAQHAHLVARALDRLVTFAGPWLGVGLLDDLVLLVARPDADLPPQLVERLELDLMRLRAIKALAADPDVPEALTQGVRMLWYRRSDYAAEAWMEAREALADADLDALFDHLDRHHPTVLGVVQQAQLRMQGVAENTPAMPLEAATLEVWRERCLPSRDVVAREAGWLDKGDGLVAYGTFSAPALVLLVCMGLGYLWTGLIGGTVIVLAQWRLRAWVNGPLMTRRLAAQAAEPLAPLHALAREHGLFPDELAHLLAPDKPLPTDDEDDRTYVDSHPLLRLQQDLSATMRVLSPVHITRIRAAWPEEGAGG